jgi:hypothetical protein
MASINGYNTGNYSCTGLLNLKADEVNATTISCDKFLDQNSNLFTGVSSNIQTQLNTINSLVSVGSTGGGYFSILCGLTNGFSTTTPFFNFGGGGASAVNIPIVQNFTFKVTSITITCQSVPTTTATVQLYKNNDIVYAMASISSRSTTFNDINIDYLVGDKFNLFTLSGLGGGIIRTTISCQVGRVTGATPQLSIGTVTNLASGQLPTATIAGTTLNPVLNFGLVQGVPGTQGPKGDTGPQGPKGDNGSDASSASGDAALAYCVGISPAPNPILAVYVSPVGVTFSGLNNCVDAIGTVLDIAVGDIATIDTTLEGIGTDISTINDEIDALQGKTQYITTDTATITTNPDTALPSDQKYTTSERSLNKKEKQD